MKHGFALIELIIASLVASMVAAILLAALSQGNRFQQIIDKTIDLSERISVVAHQLQKDLSGAFIPVQAEKSAKVIPEESTESSAETQQNDQKKAASKEQPSKEAVEKKEQKPIEKIFYSVNKNGNLDTLTFITNNPLLVYVGKDVGVVKPHVVRVQYSLKPEAGKKDSYGLYRQESMELDLEKYKNVREYEVIGGIKKCTIKFIARIEKKEEKKEESSDQKSKVSYEYKELSEWVSEQKKEAENKEQEFPRIPYDVEMTLVLWDMQEQKEQTYSIRCHIPVDFAVSDKQSDKQVQKQRDTPPDKSAEQQPSAPSSDKTNKQVTGGQETVVYNEIETTLVNVFENITKMFG